MAKFSTASLLRESHHDPADPRADFALVAARIDRWLLNGPPQQHAGEHAGAVAGMLTQGDGALYVYPEITGYYLQWLAWRSRHHRSEADRQPFRERACAAAGWLAHWAASKHPRTRVHLAGSVDDWRNEALFTFDLAMGLWGIASATRHALIAPEPETVQAFCTMLCDLVGADGEFDACRTFGGRVVPRRWSTNRGAYLAKAAAGVLRAAEILPIPAVLVEAAARSFNHSVTQLLRDPHDEMHPLLYAYEGALSCGQRTVASNHLADLCVRFSALWDAAESAGRVPELCSAPDGTERLDVLAQMVRIARLLGRIDGLADRWTVAWAQRRLADSVAPDGSVPFARNAAGTMNVWAAMFASQALGGMDADVTADADDPLIV
ncbi:MAG: hypothetical protein ABI920_01160 [Casimicrobiaceae bacterium]